MTDTRKIEDEFRRNLKFLRSLPVQAQGAISLAALIHDEAQELDAYLRPFNDQPLDTAKRGLRDHVSRCKSLYLLLCEQASSPIPDARVVAAALKVAEALGNTDVDQIRIPGQLALALLNLERVTRGLKAPPPSEEGT